jgi:hypothetical protein
MNSEPYELLPGFPGWIRVCAWCYPGEKILDLFPDLRGKVQISHSICPAHKKAALGAILARVKTATPEKTNIGFVRFEALKGAP